MPHFVDLSEYINSVEIQPEPDDLASYVPGLRKTTITLSGTWADTAPAVADLAVRIALSGRRAPRKSKKALRKLWLGSKLTTKECARLSRLTFLAVDTPTSPDGKPIAKPAE